MVTFRDVTIDDEAARAAARVLDACYREHGDVAIAMGAALCDYDNRRVFDHYVRLEVRDRGFVMAQAVVGYLQWRASYERAEAAHAALREGRG